MHDARFSRIVVSVTKVQVTLSSVELRAFFKRVALFASCSFVDCLAERWWEVDDSVWTILQENLHMKIVKHF